MVDEEEEEKVEGGQHLTFVSRSRLRRGSIPVAVSKYLLIKISQGGKDFRGLTKTEIEFLVELFVHRQIYYRLWNSGWYFDEMPN